MRSEFGILVIAALIFIFFLAATSGVLAAEAYSDDLPLTNLTPLWKYYAYWPNRADIVISEMNLSNSAKVIGYSAKNNTIKMVRFGTTTPRSRVVIITRQHGAETAGSFMSEGYIIKARQDPYYTSRIRTYWIPIANMDGAIANRDFYNMNRYWNSTEKKEVNLIRDAVDGIGNITVVIDQHSLGGDEMYSEIKISSKSWLNSTWICGEAKKRLPTFRCSVTGCPANNTARGYYCNKGVKYSILVETSMSNKSYTPEVTYENGMKLEEFVKAIAR